MPATLTPTPAAPPKKKTPRKDSPGGEAALTSAAETRRLILAAVRRGGADGLTLPAICERAGLSYKLALPTVGNLVADRLLQSAENPRRYKLASSAARASATALRDLPKIGSGTYRGEELKQNPGIGPERFAAYALPSRVGNRLYYPDGRVAAVNNTQAGAGA